MAFALPKVLTEVYESLLSIKIAVNSPDTRDAVNRHWGNCTSWLKQNKTATDLLKAPFKKAIKEIDDANKPMREKVEAMERDAERAIVSWDRQEAARIAAANTKKIDRYETKTAIAEAKAIHQGKPVPFVPPPALESGPAKTTTVGDTKVTTVERTDWWVKGFPQPLDEYGLFNGEPGKAFKEFSMKDNLERNLGIPAEYFTLDVSKVGKIMRAKGTIPGIESIKVQSLSGRQV